MVPVSYDNLGTKRKRKKKWETYSLIIHRLDRSIGNKGSRGAVKYCRRSFTSASSSSSSRRMENTECKWASRGGRKKASKREDGHRIARWTLVPRSCEKFLRHASCSCRSRKKSLRGEAQLSQGFSLSWACRHFLIFAWLRSAFARARAFSHFFCSFHCFVASVLNARGYIGSARGVTVIWNCPLPDIVIIEFTARIENKSNSHFSGSRHMFVKSLLLNVSVLYLFL